MLLLLPTCLGALALATTATAAAGCNDCSNKSPEPYKDVPAPWTLKGTVYSTFLLPGLGIPLDGKLPQKTFPPLERQFPSAIEGNYTGKIGIIQVVRYTESPVGPYDEMFIIPGFFEYDRDGKVVENLRVSRIYVSHKYVTWSSRRNWNMPKHIAHFDWTSNSADGSETVKIYPFDTTASDDSSESHPSKKPWFQMTFSPLLPEKNILGLGLDLHLDLGLLSLDGLNPKIPFSYDLIDALGVNLTLAQPPVPRGNDLLGAIVSGGEGWKAVVPGQKSLKTSVGTMDLDQSGGDGEEEGVNAVGDEFERNFWPGMLRYSVGLKMEEAELTFGETERWG